MENSKKLIYFFILIFILISVLFIVDYFNLGGYKLGGYKKSNITAIVNQGGDSIKITHEGTYSIVSIDRDSLYSKCYREKSSYYREYWMEHPECLQYLTPTTVPPTPMPPTLVPPTFTPTLVPPTLTPTLVPPTPMPPPPLPPTPTPIPTPTNTPISVLTPIIENELSNEELVNKNMQLKLLALNLINADRLKEGLNKVKLGNNPAAQIHAEDSAKYEYLSHWMLNGEKPYQLYSRTGGTSYANENAGSGGWTIEEWESGNCNSINIICEVYSAEDLIYEQHDNMMNDDWECCENGHRDQILNPAHLLVNIGIATNENGRYHGFFQHFEGGHFTANLDYRNDYLSLVIYNNTYKYNFSDYPIQIYYDPLPESIANSDGKHPEKYEEYWIGGGYEKCGIDDCLVADIIQPPPPGSFYSDLEPKDVVASKWEIVTSNPNMPSDKLTVQANLSNIKLKRGIYSVLVWGENIENAESENLIELTFTVDR